VGSLTGTVSSIEVSEDFKSSHFVAEIHSDTPDELSYFDGPVGPISQHESIND
jgi:hypothetical protein